MANLTDSELKKRLQAYNIDVGPLSSSTRYLWEKKLVKLEKSRKLTNLSPTESSYKNNIVPKSPSRRGRKKSKSVKDLSVEDLSSPDMSDEPGSTPFPKCVRRSVRVRSLSKTPEVSVPIKRRRRDENKETPKLSATKCRKKPGRPPSKLQKLNKRHEDSNEDDEYFSATELSKDNKKTLKPLLNCLIFKGITFLFITVMFVFLMGLTWLSQIETLRGTTLNDEPPQISD